MEDIRYTDSQDQGAPQYRREDGTMAQGADTSSRGYGFDVSAAVLKWVAIVTMFIDHTAASILEWSLESENYLFDSTALAITDGIMRCIGRTAFPLFIFMMAEGLYYTRSRKNYLIRLIAFCFISEVPFDLAFGYYRTGSIDLSTNLFVSEYQNVYFTLALGLAAIWIMNALYENMSSVVWEIILDLVVLAAFGYAAYLMKTDYDAGGVMAIAGAHITRRFRLKPVLSGVVIIVILCLTSGIIEAAAAFIALPLLGFYHGNRGYRFNKWIFYVFYPAHLFLLALIRTVIFA
ncbi:MAG: conjugal transfer protein TraX [Lachnospiraceae bacterium]|nr:conjugal transfer protein TraX [Lachnospiraceae bacterium]